MGERRKRHAGIKVTLWTLIVPPALWAGHFMFSYLWAAISCAKEGRFAKFPVVFAVGTLIALALIVLSGWSAWKQQRAVEVPPPHEGGTAADRLRFMAKAKLLLAGLSLVAVLFNTLPVVFLGDCR